MSTVKKENDPQISRHSGSLDNKLIRNCNKNNYLKSVFRYTMN